ncbi:MAG: right-handed parallel beta-helix repeat-containing protein [Lachnospiraceae bacterium]|jgi:hypothetical protein|nr:right-handed parallel beta-helix repeat-containing protein [Lachnospiraceae bacterium]MEE3461261.1 right-handed parallel beta-helix repeat-containing protein [Lachnospiraceae bacterium]
MTKDTLVLFNEKKNQWLTPRHHFYFRDEKFRTYYAAAVYIQASLNTSARPLSNVNFQRLIYNGLDLNSNHILEIMRLKEQPAVIIDYLVRHLDLEMDKYIFILDLLMVSVVHDNILEPVSEEDKQSIRMNIELFSRLMSVPISKVRLLKEFMDYVDGGENDLIVAAKKRLDDNGIHIKKHYLRFYYVNFNDVLHITQKLLDEKKTITAVDMISVDEDITVKSGQSLTFDNAYVELHGGISIIDGKFVSSSSQLIKKENRNKYMIEVRGKSGLFELADSHADCASRGACLRSYGGRAHIRESLVSDSVSSSAVKFSGRELFIENSTFENCYSPADGGAVFIENGSEASIDASRFVHCEGRFGGAIYAGRDTVIRDCMFENCIGDSYGAAVFYDGMIFKNVTGLKYRDCYPRGTETIQLWSQKGIIEIRSEIHIKDSVLIDSPVYIAPTGRLFIERASIFLSYPIRCLGMLNISRSSIRCTTKFAHKFNRSDDDNFGNISAGPGVNNSPFDRNSQNGVNIFERDMIVVNGARGCEINNSSIDGSLVSGGIYAVGTHIVVKNTIFKNMSLGRAIFNAQNPDISGCVFNYCEKGGIYCDNGTIVRSVFVNCRAHVGAGIQMTGKKGTIKNCRFNRCVSDIGGGGIDRRTGITVTGCTYLNCKPENIR